ncbi:RHS repeat-associated core domain-containing protein [Roseomonas rosulenta]|uniref:RHS repeat-associated core domain-containing protein n=1 Tax=Roseomonas rosulenta TaxID=2748667 RepID=UPI0018E05980|nr:RHS repeat-associated core domain-containing protein [Roseomonas rosulenta]
MMPAAKHGDPQLGVDIHLCVVPPSPSPVPLPTPHTSIVFDPMDYVPFIGATVTVCGMKRAVAGTAGIAIHIPPGFPFAPKLPDKDDEIFMGSATVVADGDPFSFLGVPVLACQVVGMPSPPRPKRKGGPRAMLLPTVFNLAIPTNVFVGGPPTISLMGMAFKFGLALLGKLAKTRFAKALGQRFQAWRKAKFGHLNPGFLKCKILRAEPVNIVTGAVSVEQEDFTLPGLIPVAWNRRYGSDNKRRGAAGTGWETPADARLEFEPETGIVLFHHPEAPLAVFPSAPTGPGDAGAVLELMDGAMLSDQGDAFAVRTKEDRIYRFPKAHATMAADGMREVPLGLVEDLCGNTLFYERDAQRRLVAIREWSGRRIEIDWSPAGFISRVWLHLPATGFRHVYVEYEQDRAGDLVAVRDALGNPYRFAYEAHHMVRHTDRNGLSFHYEFDRAPGGWRVTRSWGDGGLHAYRFEYLDAAMERRITDSLGHVSVVTLDERGLPLSEVDPLGGKTVFEYDEAGRTTAVVDQDDHRTEYAFDERGSLLALLRPDGSAFGFEHGPHGPQEVVDPNGGVWKLAYDARGRLVRRETPGGLVTLSEYDQRGRLVAVTEPDGVRRRMLHDDHGKVVALFEPDGSATRFEYDALGALLAVVDRAGRRTEYLRDPKGRLVAGRLADGGVVRLAYDAQDRLTHRSEPDGGTSHFEYGGTGTLRRRIRRDGTVLTYTHDPEERLLSVRAGLDGAHVFTRDSLGRIVAETDPMGGTRRYALTAGGRLAGIEDACGRRIRIETDGMGRTLLHALTDPRRPGEEDVEDFVYDGFGNVVAATNRHGRVERAYDADGRLVAERQGTEVALATTYGSAALPLRRSLSVALDGVVVECEQRFDIDASGALAGIAIGGVAEIGFERDARGRITTETLGGGIRRLRRHDAEGRPIAQAVLAGERELLRQRFAYGPDGQLMGRDDSDFGRDSWRYDAAGNLVAHRDGAGRSASFDRDAAGRRLLGKGTSRQVAGTPIAYSFDACGCAIERRGPEGRIELDWDGFGRLQESRAEDGTVIRYSYDALGRRIAKQTPEGTSRLLWHGDVMVGEIATARAGTTRPALRHWVHRPGSAEPLAVMEWSAADAPARILFHHTEPNGFPTRLVAQDGSIAWSGRLGPWGACEDEQAVAADNPIRLQNQYCDAETGLHYNRHRYYDPLAGMFLSRDPIGLLGGSDLHAYAPNVLLWIDPLGLNCTVYRVEGKGNQRVFGKGDAVSIPEKNKYLYVSFDDPAHAEYFRNKHLAEFPDTEIKAFDVPDDIADQIRAKAVPQAQGRMHPGAPQISDPTIADKLGMDQRDILGVKGDDIALLEDNAIPGTLRTIP